MSSLDVLCVYHDVCTLEDRETIILVTVPVGKRAIELLVLCLLPVIEFHY